MRISAVVAHPDDEIIGLGGTILKHINNGDEFQIIILCEGKSSRYEKYEYMDSNILKKYNEETKESMECLGVNNYMLCNYPNNRLDTLPLLDIIKDIQKKLDEFRTSRVYTHSYSELNIDHLIVNKAVSTAVRALPNAYVKELLFFSTLSSTEQARTIGQFFEPNFFVDISDFIEEKIKAMSCYKSELRSAPHPRCLENIRANDRVCGSKIGCNYAEEFVVGRIIN